MPRLNSYSTGHFGGVSETRRQDDGGILMCGRLGSVSGEGKRDTRGRGLVGPPLYSGRANDLSEMNVYLVLHNKW